MSGEGRFSEPSPLCLSFLAIGAGSQAPLLSNLIIPGEAGCAMVSECLDTHQQDKYQMYFVTTTKTCLSSS